jgi:hypothetical protein
VAVVLPFRRRSLFPKLLGVVLVGVSSWAGGVARLCFVPPPAEAITAMSTTTKAPATTAATSLRRL